MGFLLYIYIYIYSSKFDILSENGEGDRGEEDLLGQVGRRARRNLVFDHRAQ